MEEILFSIISTICFFACILWGCFAVEMQDFIHPNTGFFKRIFIFIINVLFCPICIFIAALQLATKNGWAKLIKRTEDTNGN